MPNPYEAPSADAFAGFEDDNDYGAHRLDDYAWVLFGFDGRIPRRTYWGWTFASNTIIVIAMVIAMVILGEDLGALVMLIAYIPLIWISLALQIKRWHDRGYSGFMMFIGIIPLIGGIWSFVELACLRGETGRNAYGADLT